MDEGTYTLVVNNSAGCSDEDAAVVTLDNEAPQASNITQRNVRCFGETNGAILVDSVSGGLPPILYSLNNAGFAGSPVFSNLPPNDYVVACRRQRLHLTSDTLHSAGTAGAGSQSWRRYQGGIEIYVSGSHDFVALTQLDTVVWSPCWTAPRAGTLFQRFFLALPQIGLTITDLNGCKATDRLNVIVDKRRHVYIPNILSPASSENSFLTIYGGQDVVEIESFQLYDRWGERIFEAYNFKPEEAKWTGKFRGEDVTPGVYVYYAVIRFIDGETEVFKGDVTVYR